MEAGTVESIPEGQAEFPENSVAEVTTNPPSDTQAVEFCKDAYARIQYELSKVVVGQNEVVQEILIAIFTRSHALLVGVPGLAKTLLISTLAQTLQMSFRRIQFTPDLMPSDITGTEVIYQDPSRARSSSNFFPARFSPMSCWRTKSTARRPRPRPQCSRRCRNAG